MCRLKTNVGYWEPIPLISKILFHYKHPLHLPIAQALLGHVKGNFRYIGRQRTQDNFDYIAGNSKKYQ